jgi:hypothetical protein
MYSLSTLSFLVSETEEKEDESFPIKYTAYWGILAVEAGNIKKDCPKEDFHVQRLAQDATIYLAWVLYFSTHFNRGNPLPSLSIQHKGSASCGSQSPVNGSSNES